MVIILVKLCSSANTESSQSKHESIFQHLIAHSVVSIWLVDSSKCDDMMLMRTIANGDNNEKLCGEMKRTKPTTNSNESNQFQFHL